jgi:endonuclease III
MESGMGKGSVNWDKVRRADVQDVFEAIGSGGLGDRKSKYIKRILDMVYEEGQARRDALLAAKKQGAEEPVGAENETEEKEAEIAHADQNVLSLQHLHSMSADDAMTEMTKYPGIGVKTASCVTLYCLRRPSFAVDTHVFRICRWLKWVPPKADENKTYMHLEVRVPDYLKYALHKLMVTHGRACPRCKASTGEGSEGWEKGCPIDHLVTRTGRMKEKGRVKKGKKANKGAESEGEDEDVEMGEDDDDGEDNEQGMEDDGEGVEPSEE